MSRLRSAAVLSVILLLPPTTAAADAGPGFTPGALGIGDPYYPLDGNGGYDVRLYDLDLTYDPGTDALDGRAVITAHATQDLSAFNLDLSGLEVESVVVDGRAAAWSHEDAELTVTPERGLRERSRFRMVIEYAGVPETLDEFGSSGFMHTDDGAIVLGQPHVAATWFPVNDHPSDKASYRLAITVPDGLEAISNGLLRGTTTSGGWSTWHWHAREPMAPYLAFMAIGEFDVREYRQDGIRFLDALDPDLFVATPRSGERAAYSGGGGGQPAYTRLTRTLTVPSAGGTVSFWVDRTGFPGAQFMVVEVRPVGTDRWTTLPDANGHTTRDTGFVCPFWLEDHPFLSHYLTAAPDGSGCSTTGTTGEWFAASGETDGFEQWSVDLGDYAGEAVELSITWVAPGFIPFPGLVVDDVAVSWGEGTTGFEDDGDVLDGWAAQGPPEGSPPNPDAWTVRTADDLPPAFGDVAEASLARQPEIIDFLEELFGRYPFRASGGVVTDHPELFFALETQTRPVYGRYSFTDPASGDSVVVHELAHQWVGDHLAIERWQHIWLNEGFATYAEWLWGEREGLATAQQSFEELGQIPAEDEFFWSVPIGDPGPENLFHPAVYDRGAATLHALRLEVGDDAFFEILRRWVREQRGGLVTTDEFVALAERVSGRDLDELFAVWLFTGEKPAGLPDAPFPEPAAGQSLRTAAAAGSGRADALGTVPPLRR